MDYHAYINSQKWRNRRKGALGKAGYRCQGCGRKGDNARGAGLHVHHLTYERLGREWARDLVVLCADCHAEQHLEAS